MRIGIDARFYGPIGKGLGRYTQEVVDNIIKINEALGDGALDFVIFLSPANFDEFNVKSPRVRKVKLNIPWYSWREQLIMPWLIAKEKLDLIHFPHFNVPIFTPTKMVVTIHDLILTHFPTVRATTKNTWVYRFKNLAYRFVLRMIIFRAEKIIAVSEFTKQDIIHTFPRAASKIVVTYEGVANLAKGRDSLFVAKLDSEEMIQKYHLGKNFLLYVGNAYPHKNLETLIRVFNRLYAEQKDLKLVLVGKEDYFYNRIKQYARSLNLWQKENLNSPVVFPGYVPDAQLEIMYQEARAYIFPSLYEGFGLPVVKSLKVGVPVITSHNSSLIEISQGAAILVDPNSTESIAKAIEKIVHSKKLRQQLSRRGIEIAKKFSWQTAAKQTLMVYTSLC